MTDTAYRVQQSRATKPMFYRAPHPAQVTARDFQHSGVEYALGVNHCLIGDEPGVGKTAQGIMISNAVKAKKTLVVCPASLRLNWEREIWTWSTKPNVTTYPILKASDGVSDKHDYNIISYDLLRNPAVLGGILAQRWDHVILDEAHAIKDPKGNKRTKAICAPDQLPRVTGRFTLLSGTILPNQPIECYNACRLLDWDSIDRMDLEDFRDHYYGEGEGMVRSKVWDEGAQAFISKVHYSHTVRNVPRHLDELQRRLRGHIMVRRLKEQVHTQLPSKQFHLVPLAITAEMRAAMKHPGWTEAAKLYDIDPAGFQAHLPIDGEISTARRLLGEAKVGPGCAYIEDLLDSGVQKLVVSAWHSSVLKVAREKLAKYGLVYMDGSTSANNRQKAVDAFQTDPNIRIILGQTKVMGEGWTLTAAQDVCLLEPDYVPGIITQMVDRIHRLGQTGSHVIAHLPIVPGTLDERIVATAVAKDRNIYQALDAA
jgi:SWI/SNF-related matrix-associated actin-dependent regulator 1 of chromatin subfamily A